MDKTSGYFFEEAKSAFESGDTDRAFLLLTRLLEFEPSHSDGQELMVRVQKKREKPSAELRTALDFYNNNPSERSAKKLGFTYKHLQRYNKAKELFKKMVEERPRDHESQGALGKIYVQLEDYEDAIPLLEDAMVKRPGDSEVLYDMGLCYFKTQQYEKSRDIYENMRIAYSGEKGVRAWLGRCHEMLGDKKAAYFFYSEELELFPWSPEGTEFLYFYYTENDDISAAYEVLENASKAVKNKPSEILSMGVMMLRCGFCHRSLDLFKYAETTGAERGYGLSLLYSNMSVAWYGLHDLPKAKEYLKKSLEVYSGCQNAIHNNGMLAYFNGNYAEAIEHLEHALSLEPDRDITLALLAEAYCAAGDMEKGIEYFEAAIKRKPKNINFLMRYARSLLAKDMDTECERIINKALLLKPDFQEAYLLLAKMKAYDLDADGAKKYLDKVTDKKNHNNEYFQVYETIINLRKNNSKRDAVKIKDVIKGILPEFKGAFTANIPKNTDRAKNKLYPLAGIISGEIHKGADFNFYYSKKGEPIAFRIYFDDLTFMLDAGLIVSKCLLIIQAADPDDKVSQGAIKRIENAFLSLK